MGTRSDIIIKETVRLEAIKLLDVFKTDLTMKPNDDLKNTLLILYNKIGKLAMLCDCQLDSYLTIDEIQKALESEVINGNKH